MANNPYVNKVQLADGTSLIDISSDTVTADKLMQGYTAHDRTGALITGTATGGGGSVTQDQDGFIVLPPDGGGSPSVGGLEHETGTWTPSEDVSNYVIPFTNTHTTAPFYFMISDAGGDYDSTSNNNFGVEYHNWHQLFGEGIMGSSSSTHYGRTTMIYRDDSTTLGYEYRAIIYPYTDTTHDTNGYSSRYWATTTGIRAYTTNTSRYWRSTRTYKWIAIWAPTT